MVRDVFDYWRRCGGAVALVSALAIVGCESPFRDEADRVTYHLEAQRQAEALGTQADVRIGPGELPTLVTPETYSKVPVTVNALPPGYAPPQPTTATSAPAPTTAPATMPATMSSSFDTLLQNLPSVKTEEMPPLPPFPRPPLEGQATQLFTLDDCFNYALVHSRDYRSQKEDLYLAALRVTLERHQFEPRLFATTSAQVSGKGESSDYAAAFSATQTVGVKQRLPYGGEVVAQALASTVNQLRDTVAESTSAEAALSANIPLLRGAGMVAQESLISTERALIYEVRDFERYRRGFLVSVASQYFNLVNQRAQIVNRYRSVESYIFITKRSQALFEAGKQSLLDVQRAAQQELSARNDLINAIEQYELAVDTFKLLLGMPTKEYLDVAPQYLNIPAPSLSEEAAVAIADRLRLDLQTTRDRVDDARRGVKVAANNLLPDLNVNAQTTFNSRGQRSLAPTAENMDYSAGLTLNWPLDRVAERNSYRISLISLDRAKRAVESNRDVVALEVRGALRRVRQQQVLLTIQKNNIDLAQKRKGFADIQFRNGKINNRDYLEAESALLDAQNRFAEALSDLEVATLQFLRDTDQLRVDAVGRLLVPTGAAAAAAAAGTQPAASQPAPTTQPG